MFNFSKKKKLANSIGGFLHGQIYKALQISEAAADRVNHMFCSAYIYGFISETYNLQGFDGNKMADKYLNHICEGIIPGRLTKIVVRNSAKLELAEEMHSPEAKADKTAFKNGVRYAKKDAEVVNTFGWELDSSHLFFFLAAELAEDKGAEYLA